ncbi:ATPase AAA [Reticulibacter mediterranei]|uniref:ATPase AAA n=1 Tax=Reticulibacter mediterranei TaxID=2778369 RepID=A0A8J3N299_9CHLR|nr:AAA domain-containing protein [Reticulibacter mediterranei]GHO92072.1 ATPase AAA [Reticulibacter mediterranei]
MAIHDIYRTDEAQQDCFLCALDRHQCHTPQLEGRFIAAREGMLDGERTASIILDTGTARVEVHLDHQYYQKLIHELKAWHDLKPKGGHSPPPPRLRIYHLPAAPSIVEYKGRTRHRYQGNKYTLAVLEPDILLNITDLNQAAYCSRQHLLQRLSPSTASAATIRGNLIHHCFKELLKEHDRGKFGAQTDDAEQETPLEVLHRHLEEALRIHSIDMALANVAADTMRSEVASHLASLAYWYETERATLWDMPTAYVDSPDGEGNQVRAETFLLAPEIGLRGRLDLFWRQAGRQRLLELKTGKADKDLPRTEHRWQVNGYQALLTVRRDARMKKALATLLYSSTPGKAQALGIPFTIRELQRVNETRNILILSHITGKPPAPPGPSRCTRCSLLATCQHVSSLLSWQPPEPDITSTEPASNGETATSTTRALRAFDTEEDRQFFAEYYMQLQEEGKAGEAQQALLWKKSVAERIEAGTAIQGLEPTSPPMIEKDGWAQTFRCSNASELREGDEILLSNGNPITGEVVTGTLLKVSSEAVTVWTREKIAHPDLIDRYDNDLVHIRTQQNLLRWWLQAETHIHDLVARKVRPRFIEQHLPRRIDFNREQNLAVERAIQMQDYLLIHGPPGTGKTSVIAEIVKQLAAQGQRILLAAFTNQAVDNMLKRLNREGFHHYVRLGHERSVEESIQPHLLKTLVGETPEPEQVRELLRNSAVVASTTATWSSDKYTPPSPAANDEVVEDTGLLFDVAIIDEAGQLTVPAILGALRFVRRFILVGDEQQLPPLVLSKTTAQEPPEEREAAEEPVKWKLSESLFSILKRYDEEYLQEHPMAMSACVPLRTQYRMNQWISNFSSTIFYNRQLVAHTSVARRYLTFPRSAQSKNRENYTLLDKVLDPTRPLVFVDVGSEAQMEGNPEAKTSDVEARAVRAIVGELLTRGIAEQDIGIIAPYRAQVANIRRHLLSSAIEEGWQGLASNSPLSVDTVDRFQGGERMVIIMSFATSYEPAAASPRREFLVNPNRLNVALTRAQRKLILVGSTSALKNLPIFDRLITYCNSMKTIITSSPLPNP